MSMRRPVLLAVFLVLVLCGFAKAGEYYLSDDKAYWWYWDDAPKYEVMTPAKAEAYAPHIIFGERSLDITLTKSGPTMRFVSISKAQGGYAAIKQAALQRWQPVLTGIKTISDEAITTSRGVKANFLAASGKTAAGTAVMIRLVAYVKGSDAVYLELFCDEKAYAGDVKAQWIKAVNTFNWR